MAGVAEFLDQIKFNGRSLGSGGQVDATAGGFTQSNAPFVFAALLRDLSRPGGPLSTLSQDKIFSGQVESAINQGRGLRTDTMRRLAANGVNETQALQQVAGIDQQVLAGISSQRSESERVLQDAIAEAKTQLANVTSQSEDIQKTRAEELRRFNKLYRNMKKQQMFSNVLGVASLALNFLPGLGPAAGLATKAAASQGGNKQGPDFSTGGVAGPNTLSASFLSQDLQNPTIGAQSNPVSANNSFMQSFGQQAGGFGSFMAGGGLDLQALANALSNMYMLQGAGYPGSQR